MLPLIEIGEDRPDHVLDVDQGVVPCTAAGGARGQVDGHTRADVDELDRVGPAAAVDAVVAEPADEPFRARRAGQAVVEARPEDALDRHQSVGPDPAAARGACGEVDGDCGGRVEIGRGVDPAGPVDGIVSAEALEEVAARASLEGVAKGAAFHVFDVPERRGAERGLRGARGEIDRDRAAEAEKGQHVDAIAAIDEVVALRSEDLVGASGAGDRVVA